MEPTLIADPAAVVTRGDLESSLEAIERKIGDPLAEIFGPESISWRINRESALFLGAGRAALMQLAHPWVAAALAEHSSVLTDPIARFHNTFRVVFTMVFGSANQALAASRSLHQLHSRISGEISEQVAGYTRGSRYEANQITALRWVFATLVESAVLAYDCVLPPLSDGERAAYYEESKTLAALFGIPPAALPPDWDSFTSYVSEMCESEALGVNELSRSMARSLLRGSGSWLRPPGWYRAMTAAWMPARLREEFRLECGPAEQIATQSARRWLGGLYRFLPLEIRFVGPYHEAVARLSHRAPGFLTRQSNRFWIGERQLPFGN